MNRCLEEAYEKNNSSFSLLNIFISESLFFIIDQPISFFMFTIHPTLFCRSVENIFHTSFLIKVNQKHNYFLCLIYIDCLQEGKAELFLDNNELPVLRKLLFL